ncbi:MAG: FAD-binding oxidoreductase [Gammaproteobacteria bacterium]|nr:FAD-binding oxidoreductase [Gammaproteobacteria bacterium]
MVCQLSQDRSDSDDHPDSYYRATQNRQLDLGPLEGSHRTDVCIIGGGYTGLSAALHLAKRGYKITLLEARKMGWGASGRNGGQLGSGQRKNQWFLEKKLGMSDAGKLWQLAEDSKDLTKSIINDYQIECDLKLGIAHPDHKPAYAAESREYIDHLHKQYGYNSIEYLDQQSMAEVTGSDTYHGGSLDHSSGHLHPLNYVLGLAAAAQQNGAILHESTIVEGYQSGKPNQVKTNRGVVNADTVILACNGYLGKLEKRLAGKIMPINNFVIATEPLDEATVKSINPRDVAIADSRFVINYYRLSADKRLLFGGGENYSSNFPADIGSFVRKPMLEIYPKLADKRIDYAWGGTLAVTLNRMPHFGRLDNKGIYFAQGYSGHGVAMATLGGKIMADAVTGETENMDLFGKIPTRPFPGGAWLRYPGLVLGMTYYALRDRL